MSGYNSYTKHSELNSIVEEENVPKVRTVKFCVRILHEGTLPVKIAFLPLLARTAIVAAEKVLLLV